MWCVTPFWFPSLQYLNLESSFEGKDDVCDRLLQFLLSEASPGASEKHSFQLMEALLYRVHLNVFTGRLESALAILQVGRHLARSSFPESSISTSPSVCVCVCAECAEVRLRQERG